VTLQNLKPTLTCDKCGQHAPLGYYFIAGIKKEGEDDVICCLSCGDTRIIHDADLYSFPEPQRRKD